MLLKSLDPVRVGAIACRPCRARWHAPDRVGSMPWALCSCPEGLKCVPCGATRSPDLRQPCPGCSRRSARPAPSRRSVP